MFLIKKDVALNSVRDFPDLEEEQENESAVRQTEEKLFLARSV